MSSPDLTDEQKKFATTRDKHVIALASAGAGKTFSLIHFINDKIKHGTKPDEIISFSFTRKASNELKERVNDFFKGKNYDFKYISTIHSFCWNQLIKPFYADIGYTAIPTIVQEFPEDFMEAEFKEYGGRKAKAAYNKDFRERVSIDLQQEDFREEESIRLLQYIIENNLVMFDFMIHLAIYVLKEDEVSDRVIESIGNINYVIVDEAQDLNPAQYNFTKLLQTSFSDAVG